MNDTPKIVIAFDNFTFQYDAQSSPTLRQIQLTIREGEKIAIIGPSGSGKSTLGHCINGLVPFYYQGSVLEGRVTIFDRQKTTIFEHSKAVGTVLQDPDAQFIALSVEEDIAFALENDEMPLTLMHSSVERAAKLVGMEAFLTQKPMELSGGQKQKIALCGILVDRVPIVLFDEPLANLDPAMGQKAIELIDELHQEQNLTTVIIEHRLEDVLHRPVDRIILLDNGAIIADMSADELLQTDLLAQYGIREPLYVSALRHSNVQLSSIANLSNMTHITFGSYQQQLQGMMQAAPKSPILHTDILLELKDISFTYNTEQPFIQQLSLKIAKGEIISLVGANGAGKSTVAQIICGFLQAASGSILLGGVDITSAPIAQRAELIGFVLQNPNAMISQTTVFDEVAQGLRIRRQSKVEIEQQVDRILQICGLKPFKNWPISALSFGQKKRVTIAAILILKPQLIIVDEPTAGQDYRHYTDIMTFLVSLQQQGINIIFITHDMHLMLEYTTRTIVLHQGEIIADDTPMRILNSKYLINKASLKTTSLHYVATQCQFEPEAFVQSFIAQEREEK